MKPARVVIDIRHGRQSVSLVARTDRGSLARYKTVSLPKLIREKSSLKEALKSAIEELTEPLA